MDRASLSMCAAYAAAALATCTIVYSSIYANTVLVADAAFNASIKHHFGNQGVIIMRTAGSIVLIKKLKDMLIDMHAANVPAHDCDESSG
jgi:hypothetical protein